MKPRQALMIVVVFGALAALITRAWLKPEDAPGYDGYVEAEDIHLAAPQGGVLQRLPVRRGEAVEAGEWLFGLDPVPALSSVGEARARRDAAEARAQDAGLGQRAQEIAALQAQWQAADAQVALAEIRLKRARSLLETRAGTPAAVDEAEAGLRVAKADADQIAANLSLAREGQRPDQRMALSAAVAEARASLAAAEHALLLTMVKAPVAGTVAETYFDPGEFVPAGTPVVAIRPPAALKIRFYVPQAALPSMRAGRPVTIGCDGCPAPIRGHVTYASEKVEYTPPVIYSQGQRDRLVFLVEAAPDDPAAFAAAGFRPGLPVRVSPE